MTKYILSNSIIFLGFKKELTEYMLVYTRNMITAIVTARGDITTVHKLTDIVKDHVSGNFNDVRVSQCTLLL